MLFMIENTCVGQDRFATVLHDGVLDEHGFKEEVFFDGMGQPPHLRSVVFILLLVAQFLHVIHPIIILRSKYTTTLSLLQ